MKYWKCTVCKYVHTGRQPPDQCPICKAGPEKFVEIELRKDFVEPGGTPTAGSEPKSPQAPAVLGPITGRIIKHHLHPMTVHVPNGVIPIAAVLVGLGIALDWISLTQAAYYNTVFVALSMPVVWITGVVEWQKKYAGALTSRFVTKIASAAVVTVILVVLIAWHVAEPDLMQKESAYRWLVLGLNLVMLAGAGVAGFVGGKLVFRD